MKYKVRMNCSSFHDVVVEASSEEEAKEVAQIYAEIYAECPSRRMEFREFLEVEKGDEIVNTYTTY